VNVRTITVNGKRWRLMYSGHIGNDKDGYCTPPDEPGRTIAIRSTLDGVRRLEVELHEMLHAADWSKDEEWVRTVAHDLAKVLWRLGYRCGGLL